MSERLNVLFVTADQWRADALSRAGHPAVRTPVIDALARRGTWFTNHWASCLPCGPSRASLLTGQYLMNHRSVRNGTPLDARHPNLARSVRAAGWSPQLFGYTDTTVDPRGLPPDDARLFTYEGVLPGFDEQLRFRDAVMPDWLSWLHELGYRPGEGAFAAYQGDPGTWEAPAAAEHSDTTFHVDRVIDHLRTAPSGFFLHASLFRPHPPLFAARRWLDAVDLDRVPDPSAAPTTTHPYLQWWQRRCAQPGYLLGHDEDLTALSPARRRALIGAYLALVAEVDHALGRLLEAVAARPDGERTLVIVTSDHGEQLGDQGLWGKGGWFDSSWRIPLIVAGPGVAAGRRVSAPTEAVDLAPSILRWLDLPVPTTMDGRDLGPWLRGEVPTSWRDSVVWELDFRDVPHRSAERALGLPPDASSLCVLRTERYKYVHFDALPPLLYDLAEDPDEQVDRAADPALAGVRADLAGRLLSHRMRHADRTLANHQVTHRGLVVREPDRWELE